MSTTTTTAERYRVGNQEWEAGAIVRVSVFDTSTTTLTTLVPLQTVESEHRTVKAIALRSAEADPQRAKARIDSVDLNPRTRCLEYRLTITR